MHRQMIPLAVGLSVAVGCAHEPAGGPVGAGYDDELDRIDSGLVTLEQRAAGAPDDWLIRERIVWRRLERARLTGDYADYAAAEATLDEAFAIAATGSGPHLARAQLDFTLHRFDRVEASLAPLEQQVLVSSDTRDAIADLRADVALQQGAYNAALTRYQIAADEKPTTTSLYRLALYQWATGDFVGAEELIRRAAAAYRGDAPMQRAWFHLQLGLLDLDRGRYHEALEHYRDGEAILFGWWLLDEHIAEVLALTGRTDQAIALYESVVARTGSPELIDALAGLLEEREPARAAALVDRAREAYEAQLAAFPEASYGHALAHYLAHDPDRAVELAEANLALRPGGPARVSAAQAYLRAGLPEAAVEVLAPALASPYASAELYATAAVAAERVGSRDTADGYRQAALAINPFVVDDLSWL